MALPFAAFRAPNRRSGPCGTAAALVPSVEPSETTMTSSTSDEDRKTATTLAMVGSFIKGWHNGRDAIHKR